MTDKIKYDALASLSVVFKTPIESIEKIENTMAL